MVGSRWANPLVVAVLAATLAAVGNAGVAFVNGRNLQASETSKAEASLILEMIKTDGNADLAARNLTFLLDTGLVAQKDRVARLQKYLKGRAAGTGVSLTSAGGKFQVEATRPLPQAIVKDLDARLNAFQAYLPTIGFKLSADNIKVKLDSENASENAYYSPESKVLFLDPRLATDKHIALIVFAEYALHQQRPTADLSDVDYHYLDIALSEYFVASFLNDPLVGQVYARVVQLGRPSLRDMRNDLSFEELSSCERIEPHERGEVWQGALWEIREKIGSKSSDRLFAQAWLATPANYPKGQLAHKFMQTVISVAETSLGTTDAAAVASIFTARGFPVDRPSFALSCPSDGLLP